MSSGPRFSAPRITGPALGAQAGVGGMAAALIAQGTKLQLAGKHAEAEACYQGVLLRDPLNADANNGMGTLAVVAKRLPLAIDFFRKALGAKPGDVRFLNNLGNALVLDNKIEEAIPMLLAVVEKKPDLYEALNNLGRAYRMRGRAAEGLPYSRRAVACAPPKDAVGLLGLGENLIAIGEAAEAEATYRAALTTGHRTAFALMGLASAKKHSEAANDLDLIDRYIAATRSGDRMALEILHNAAGKVAIDLKRYDKAFEHFRAAKRGRKPFSLPNFSAGLDSLVATFPAASFAGAATLGSSSDLPIFVLGMPRSGTTLVEQILASHSAVTAAGELPHLLGLANDLAFSRIFDGAPEAFARAMATLTPERASTLTERYLRLLRWHSESAARITDKMPHNFMLVGLIALLFPKAKVVHCRRDPIDNCVSIYTNWFNEQHGYADDLKTLGLYYREYDRLMAHWRAVLPPGQMLEVQYEAMVADQEGETRRLIDFVGLPFEEATLAPHKAERTVTTISRWQVRQPVYTSSVKRWKHFAPFIGDLIAGLGDLARVD